MNYLEMLTQYKSWADTEVFTAVSELTEEELMAPRPIIFGSILRTLNHVLAMDQVWQAHLKGSAHGHLTRNPTNSPSLVEVRTEQLKLNTWFMDYAQALTPTQRNAAVAFDFIGGGSGKMTRESILLHVVNHATYHRGHVADMMYNCSVSPPTTDLPVFLRDISKG